MIAFSASARYRRDRRCSNETTVIIRYNSVAWADECSKPSLDFLDAGMAPSLFVRLTLAEYGKLCLANAGTTAGLDGPEYWIVEPQVVGYYFSVCNGGGREVEIGKAKWQE